MRHRLPTSDLAAIILAGGKATRFGGVAKHAIVVDPIEGRTILERQRAILEPLCAELVVASTAPIAGVRTVPDAIEGGGPLAGIAAGLAAVAAPWAIVVAGDMPYLTTALVERLIGAIDEAHEAVAFRVGGLPEPLCCALRVAPARAAVVAMLAAGDRKASRLLDRLSVCWLDATTDEQTAFRNLNSPDDLPAKSGI